MKKTQKQTETKTITKATPELEEIVEATPKPSLKDLRQNKKSLIEFFQGSKEDLCHIKADILKESDIDKYFTQMSLYLANNESLAKCFDSIEGKMSLIGMAVREAVEMGVLPGVDADIIAYKKTIIPAGGTWRDKKEVYTAELQPSAEAYEAICLSEPNPVFSQIKTGVVYEKDMEKTTIKVGFNGEINHIVNLAPDRGSIVGVWIECLPPIDSQKQTIVDYWSKTRIIKIRDNHSTSWKKYQEDVQLFADCKSGKIKTAQKQDNGNYKIPKFYKNGGDRWVNDPESLEPIWLLHEEGMYEKTIKKGVLKRPAKVKRALSRLLVINEEQAVVSETPEVDQGISSKADNVLNQVKNDLKPENDEHAAIYDGIK